MLYMCKPIKLDMSKMYRDLALDNWDGESLWMTPYCLKLSEYICHGNIVLRETGV
jgi:hypothetical protein